MQVRRVSFGEMKTRRALLTRCLTLAAGLLLAAFLWVDRGDRPAPAGPAVASVQTEISRAAKAPAQIADAQAAGLSSLTDEAPALPEVQLGLPPAVLDRLERSSLRGSRPDGQLRFDAQGRLVVDAELRRHLEWWLSLLGELPLEQIRDLFRLSLPGEMTPALAAEALAFFDRWIDYLRDADASLPDGSTLARLDALAALRRQWFGEADSEALFGDEERYTRHVLARQAVLRDPSLSAEQRAEALTELDAQLSPEQRQMRAATVDPLLLSEQTAQFERLQIDPAQRHAERSALVGPEAADRLAQLDLQRQDWEQRMNALREAARQWQSNQALTGAERESRLQAWLELHGYSEAEQRRARALLALPEDEH